MGTRRSSASDEPEEGAGTRSGQGASSILPYLSNSLKAKPVAPDHSVSAKVGDDRPNLDALGRVAQGS